MKHRRDFQNVIEAARERGWTVTATKGGHMRLTHPSGGLIHTASTPSEYRGIKNLDARLRRAERLH